VKYRDFGKLDWKVSALGFGAMRLPTRGGEASKIDEAEAIKMIRYAIDHGVNYVDTAYSYHGGKSEELVGKALRDGYRERVRVATKMPTWLVKSERDMNKFLGKQLGRLKLDFVDFYLLHGLTKSRWESLQKLEVCRWAEKKIHDGKMLHFGFSFHDEFSVFKNIIDGYDGWTFCQIQYNYVDSDYQAGTKGLEYAASKGLAVVVMEPVAGGRLGMTPPAEVQAIFDEALVKRTPAEWALQWVWNHPEVSVALSGMSTMKQVMENVESASRSGPNTLAPEDLDVINRVRQKYKKQGFVGCTGCRYCMPCPSGVDIPQVIALFNEYYVEEMSVEVKEKYRQQVNPKNQAKKCSGCGKCEEKCPQHLSIREVMSRAAMVFE
jgi:predicted aldo/keto reductase-like oxidoreductase